MRLCLRFCPSFLLPPPPPTGWFPKFPSAQINQSSPSLEPMGQTTPFIVSCQTATYGPSQPTHFQSPNKITPSRFEAIKNPQFIRTTLTPPTRHQYGWRTYGLERSSSELRCCPLIPGRPLLPYMSCCIESGSKSSRKSTCTCVRVCVRTLILAQVRYYS